MNALMIVGVLFIMVSSIMKMIESKYKLNMLDKCTRLGYDDYTVKSNKYDMYMQSIRFAGATFVSLSLILFTINNFGLVLEFFGVLIKYAMYIFIILLAMTVMGMYSEDED